MHFMKYNQHCQYAGCSMLKTQAAVSGVSSLNSIAQLYNHMQQKIRSLSLGKLSAHGLRAGFTCVSRGKNK